MNARLAAMLTGAHARAWQRRYGVEFCALLEELPASPPVVTSAMVSAISSQTPAMVAIAALALAAAILALGPSASDRRLEASHGPALRATKPSVSWNANSTCATDVAYVGSDGSIRC
jgi:hypothetical protein